MSEQLKDDIKIVGIAFVLATIFGIICFIANILNVKINVPKKEEKELILDFEKKNYIPVV